MKKIVISILLPLLFSGCSRKIISDKEMIESFNFYMLRDYSFEVKSINDLDCNLNGYRFPNEKKIPYYSCTGMFLFTTGHQRQLNIEASRRINGELIVDSTSTR